MSLLGSALATMLIILTFSAGLFTRMESDDGVRTQTFQQDVNIFNDYSNYVRDMFRRHQQAKSTDYSRMLSSLNSGGKVVIDGANAKKPAGATVFKPYNNMKLEYATKEFVADNKVGHILAREKTPYSDPQVDVLLYVWTVPDAETVKNNKVELVFAPNRSFDALVKSDYNKTGRLHYIKQGRRIIRNGGIEYKDLRSDVASLIPDGALVLVNHPFESGPVH